MKILVITPIVSDTFNSMTEATLSKSCKFTSQIDFVSLDAGPLCIEGFADEVYAAPYVLDLVKKNLNEYDGFFINCFGDVAVDAIREITDKPILGAGEAAFFMASSLGVPFSIITIGSNARNKMTYRFKGLGCSRFVSSVGIEEGVLELNASVETTAKHIAEAAEIEVKERGTEVIVLGCTGMIDAANMVRDMIKHPVVEPTSAGLKLLEDQIELGIGHCRGGKYNVL